MPFLSALHRDMMLLMLITSDTNFDQLNKVVSFRFLLCKVIFPKKKLMIAYALPPILPSYPFRKYDMK